jgi:hypothetical protein
MKRLWVAAGFVLIAGSLPAQNNTGAYLIPPAVYVGDMAGLILPLPGLAADSAADIILAPDSPDFPSDPDFDFHRILLERRLQGSRLLIEFSAFRPGLLELPPIEIGGERFTGLRVEIRSVIDSSGSGLELAGPASALAVPGTASMVYGTIAGLVLFAGFIVWLLLRGRRYLHILISKWKRRRLIISMKIIARRLYRTLLKNGKSRETLDRLSHEFRAFLSYFTGENCRAMTSRELEQMPVFFESDSEMLKGGFLGKLFRRCDELRFSGGAIAAEDVFPVLADLRSFLEALEKAEKEKNWLKEEKAA